MKGDVQVEPPADNEAMARARVLSRPARLHFMYALSRLTPGDIWHERGGNVLSDLTTYKLRENHLDASKTTPELLSTGLFEYSTGREAYMHFLLKDDLIIGCEKTGTEYAKSWRKAEILDALQSNASGYLASVMEEKGVVTLSLEYEDELIELTRYAEKLVKPCRLLWFA